MFERKFYILVKLILTGGEHGTEEAKD